MKKKPNPLYEDAPYELSFRFYDRPQQATPGIRFLKPPPASVWADDRKFNRWVSKNGVHKYLP